MATAMVTVMDMDMDLITRLTRRDDKLSMDYINESPCDLSFAGGFFCSHSRLQYGRMGIGD